MGFQNSAAAPDLVFLCGSLVLIDEAAEDGPALYPAPAPAHRPHLTLASAERFLPAAAAAIAGALHVLPIQVRLDGVRFFGDRAGVLAWAVDDDGALRELQAQVWLALDGAGRRPQHEPGLWTPHVSLAQRLRPG